MKIFSKKNRKEVQKIIKKEKQNFHEINLKQKLHKLKQLWKTLKYMGLSSKAASALNICLKDKNKIFYNNTKNSSIFKSFFSNLAQNLVSKLPPSPNAFTESKVAWYYDNIKFKDLNFNFSEISPEIILNILESLNPSKAAGINNLSGKFLKDDTDIFARLISQLCNLSIKLCLFPRSCKIVEMKLLFKKRLQSWPSPHLTTPQTIERIIHDQIQVFQ